MCLSAGRTKATLVEPVTPNTQNMTAASVRFSRQCGLCCSVQSQNCFNRDAGGGGGGGGGVPVHSNRPNGGRCGWTAVGRRLKAQTGRRASCIGLSSMHGCGSSSTPSGPSNTALDPSHAVPQPVLVAERLSNLVPHVLVVVYTLLVSRPAGETVALVSARGGVVQPCP